MIDLEKISNRYIFKTKYVLSPMHCHTQNRYDLKVFPSLSLLNIIIINCLQGKK